MDEIEWFGGGDPTRMLGFLRTSASGRKLRLFACACCDRIGQLFAGDHSREALAVIARFADGRETQSELVAVRAQTTGVAIFEATGEDAAFRMWSDLDVPRGQGAKITLLNDDPMKFKSEDLTLLGSVSQVHRWTERQALVTELLKTT